MQLVIVLCLFSTPFISTPSFPPDLGIGDFKVKERERKKCGFSLIPWQVFEAAVLPQ